MGTFQVGPGSLFPALYRLEKSGWAKSFWAQSENNRRAKYYQLTSSGRKQLQTATEEWQRISSVMSAALHAF
jgi:PadR family transcriptional regulator PadR